jgi:hypothetical protein
MKVLSIDEAAAMLQAESLDSALGERARTLRQAGMPYAIPSDAEMRIALAKFLGCLLMRGAEPCIYFTGWNQRPHFEHLDLLYGYRRSVGESRPLSLAPVHLFDRSAADAMISILCLALVFGLEAWIFDRECQWMGWLEHTGTLTLRSSGKDDREIVDFAADPARYLQPFLAMKKSA